MSSGCLIKGLGQTKHCKATLVFVRQPCPRHHNQNLKRFGSKACVLEGGAECLSQFMDKKLFVHLQGGRKVSGTLRGYDLFLNLVIDDALEETTPAQKHPIGTVVCGFSVLSDPLLYLYRSYEVTALRRWKFWRRCDRPKSKYRTFLTLLWSRSFLRVVPVSTSLCMYVKRHSIGVVL